jgi:hypothetical protein
MTGRASIASALRRAIELPPDAPDPPGLDAWISDIVEGSQDRGRVEKAPAAAARELSAIQKKAVDLRAQLKGLDPDTRDFVNRAHTIWNDAYEPALVMNDTDGRGGKKFATDFWKPKER